MTRSNRMKFRLRESNTVLDSGFPAMDSVFQVLNSSLCQCGPWILDPTLSGIRVSLSCIPDSKAQDSRVDKQNFPGFQGHPKSIFGKYLFGRRFGI